MKQLQIIIGSLLIASCANADRLHTVTFETENDGYTPSTVWTDAISGNVSDYFMRAEDQQTSGMVPFSNIEGSYFWAMEDTDNLLDVPNITTTSIDITGYTLFTATVAFAVDDGGSSSFIPANDYIDFEYSIDGGAFVKFGSLLVNEADWRLLKDNDLNGTGDEVSGITSTFTDVDFSFEGSGSTLQFRVSSSIGGSDEMGLDNIRIDAAIPEPSSVMLLSLSAIGIFAIRRYMS